MTETTTFYAEWTADYVPFDAILRIENADDTAMTQADILGRWYAKAGSQIKVKSTYSGTGSSRTGSHQVFCVMDGVEYPVYTDAALTRQATVSDAYATYFVFNNAGTQWSDEVNWDDIYTGGQLPYSTRPVSSIAAVPLSLSAPPSAEMPLSSMNKAAANTIIPAAALLNLRPLNISPASPAAILIKTDTAITAARVHTIR